MDLVFSDSQNLSKVPNRQGEYVFTERVHFIAGVDNESCPAIELRKSIPKFLWHRRTERVFHFNRHGIFQVLLDKKIDFSSCGGPVEEKIPLRVASHGSTEKKASLQLS